MISILVEHIARFLADRRLHHEDVDRQHQEARLAQEKAQAKAFAVAEADRAPRRLELARQLLAQAQAFAEAPEARWAINIHGFAPVAHLLKLDRHGRLVYGGVLGWYRRVPDQVMDSPAMLTSTLTTAEIAGALRALGRRGSWYWPWALRYEARLFWRRLF